MKKLSILWLILFTTTMGFAQQQQYVFDFETGDPDGVAANWITFDNSPPPATIIDNPDLDGTNATLSKVLRVEVGPGNAFYAGVNNRWQDEAFGTWKIDAAVSSNMTVTMDINKNYVGTVGIKMSTNTGGTAFELTNQNVGNTVVDEWQTLTWTLPAIPPTLETNLSQFVVFVDWTQGMPDRAPGSIIHIDNITFNAEKLTDPPTCTDGIQNGSETGIDCGGSTCAPCAGATGPTDNAATPPTRNATDVISIYGGAYTNLAIANYDPNWGQSGHTQVNTSYDPGTGDLVMHYPNFNYQGTDFGSTEDASTMEFFHVDVWTQDATVLQVSPINDGATGTGAGEVLVNVPLVQSGWSSVDIPKSAFTGMTWDALIQLKFDGQAGTTPSDIYLDNIYFYKGMATTPPTSPTDNAPVPPARNASDVVSIYGDAYTNLAIANYDPNWGQSGHTQVNTMFDPGTGDLVMNYPNFNYQGTDFGSTQDLSAMEFVHIDIWTPNATDVKFSPINDGATGTGAGETLVDVPVIIGQWSSVDLPKSAFTGMTWDAIFQLKFDGQAGVNPSDLFIDNIYFYKGQPLSNNDVELNVFSAYPNPTSNNWVINSANTMIDSVQVYDLTGKLVIDQIGDSTSLELNANGLSQGMYIAKVSSASGVQNIKLIKE